MCSKVLKLKIWLSWRFSMMKFYPGSKISNGKYCICLRVSVRCPEACCGLGPYRVFFLLSVKPTYTGLPCLGSIFFFSSIWKHSLKQLWLISSLFLGENITCNTSENQQVLSHKYIVPVRKHSSVRILFSPLSNHSSLSFQHSFYLSFSASYINVRQLLTSRRSCNKCVL